MCNPAVFLIASAAVTAVGKVQQGRDASAAADVQADQLDYAGQTATSDALAQAQMIRKSAQTTEGASDAAAAASGVRVGVGSTLEDDRTILQNSEHDAHMAILNGQRQASKYAVDAALTRQGGASAQQASDDSAFGSVLQSGAMLSGSGWKTGGGSMAGAFGNGLRSSGRGF